MEVSRFTAIENVNKLANEISNTAVDVVTWGDAYHTASRIVRNAVKHSVAFVIWNKFDYMKASNIADGVMMVSSTIDGVVSRLMDLVFDGISKHEFFTNVNLEVRAWFVENWKDESKWLTE